MTCDPLQNRRRALRGALAPAALFLLAALLAGCSDRRHSQNISGHITSVAKAYPVAQRMQIQYAPGTYLQSVIVIWDRDGTEFNIQKVTYVFGLPGGAPGTAISMDNERHLAYVETNSPGSANFGEEVLPVDFSGKEVQDILQIALRDTLGGFCSSVPPGKDTILFQLHNTDRGPSWHIMANGPDAQGAVVQMRMDIDANSGDVLNRSFNTTKMRK